MTATIMLPSHGPTCSHARDYTRKDIINENAGPHTYPCRLP